MVLPAWDHPKGRLAEGVCTTNAPLGDLSMRSWGPTRLDKIKNLHGLDTIDTKSCGTRGRSIWIQPGKVRRIDKWLCHLDPNDRFEHSQMGLGGLYAVPGLTLRFCWSDYGTFYSHYRIL